MANLVPKLYWCVKLLLSLVTFNTFSVYTCGWKQYLQVQFWQRKLRKEDQTNWTTSFLGPPEPEFGVLQPLHSWSHWIWLSFLPFIQEREIKLKPFFFPTVAFSRFFVKLARFKKIPFASSTIQNCFKPLFYADL